MYGGQAGILSDYNCSYDYFFIIGGDGVIKWRGRWNEAAMTAAFDNAIAELGTTPVPNVPTDDHQLLANYPNPFNPMTRIPYVLGGSANTATVHLEILDIGGRLIKTLVQGEQATGQRYEVSWNGTNRDGRQVPSGVYLTRLRIDGVARSRIITLVK